MPKIKIIGGVYMYLLEIILLATVPLFFIRPQIYLKFKMQRYLFCMSFSIFLITCISNLIYFDPIGIAKAIKYFIYIPLVYFSYMYYKNRDISESMNQLINIGIFAIAMNMIIYFYNLSNFGFNNWDINLLSSGLSNKYIDFTNLSINTLSVGSHAIWGNYCVLIFTLSIIARLKKYINSKKFLLAISLSLGSILISVSRTSLLTLSFVCIGFIISIYKGNWRISTRKSLWLILIVAIIVPIIMIYYDKLAIVAKLLYTIDAFITYGKETNLQIRFNTWYLILLSFYYNPIHMVLGYGYNILFFNNILSEVASLNEFNHLYASVPESLMFQIWAYGGVISLSFLLRFCYHLVNKVKRSILGLQILHYYFIGIIFGDMISGVTLLSDLLYGQILILIGLVTVQSLRGSSTRLKEFY